MYQLQKHNQDREPWNKGKLMGQKLPLTLQEIWSIRMRLQSEKRFRDMALFNLAIDSKLRACDLLKIRVSDISSSGQVNSRATIMQQKTQRPVRFEITSRTRSSIERWIEAAELSSSRYLFPSRINGCSICRPGSMRESSSRGWLESVWTQLPMGRILSGGRKPH